jgi:hypothetical protein
MDGRNRKDVVIRVANVETGSARRLCGLPFFIFPVRALLTRGPFVCCSGTPQMRRSYYSEQQDIRDYLTLHSRGSMLLGPRQWRLLFGLGRVIKGSYSGVYVSALPISVVHGHLDALYAGEAIPVHLMHREHPENSELSTLVVCNGALSMRFENRLERA